MTRPNIGEKYAVEKRIADHAEIEQPKRIMGKAVEKSSRFFYGMILA